MARSLAWAGCSSRSSASTRGDGGVAGLLQKVGGDEDIAHDDPPIGTVPVGPCQDGAPGSRRRCRPSPPGCDARHAWLETAGPVLACLHRAHWRGSRGGVVPKVGFDPTTFRLRVGCSASAWMAPDGSGLLTLEASSVQTASEGCRRIVWMIIGMIKRIRQDVGWQGEHGLTRRSFIEPRASLGRSVLRNAPRRRPVTLAADERGRWQAGGALRAARTTVVTSTAGLARRVSGWQCWRGRCGCWPCSAWLGCPGWTA